MKYRPVLSLITVLCLVSPLQAEIYKWTDEEGGMHFSDKPPGKDAPQYQLRKPVSPENPSSPRALSEAERRAKQRKLMESLEADRLEKEQAVAKQKQQQAISARNCQYARAELRASKDANLIYDYDSKGNKIYLREVQKQNYLKSKYAAVRKWCE